MSASGRRPIVRAVPVVAVPLVALLLVALLLLARWWSGAWRLHFQDLQVYRDGARAFWHGRSVYGISSVDGLPFTYPPFAAFVFIPLSVGPLPVVVACFAAASVGALWKFLRISLNELDSLHALDSRDALGALDVRNARNALRLSGSALATALVLSFALEPVGRTIGLGQINLILDVAVLADACRVPAHRRGYLTGLVAGVKVVPLVFALHYALQRDWPAVRRLVGTCAATVALSGAIAPHDTLTYWTRLVFDPSRVGAAAYVDNQSLLGAAARTIHNSRPERALTVSLSLAALLVAALAARGQLRRGSDLAALCCVATGGLLAAPVSWSHHWVWIIPMILVLIHQRRPVAAAVFTAVAYLSPHWYLPSGRDRELHYPWWQTVLTLDFVALGIAFLCIMLLDARRAAVRLRSSAPLGQATRRIGRAASRRA